MNPELKHAIRKKPKSSQIEYSFLFVKDREVEYDFFNWTFKCVNFNTAVKRFVKKEFPYGYLLDHEVEVKRGNENKREFIDISDHEVLSKYL